MSAPLPINVVPLMVVTFLLNLMVVAAPLRPAAAQDQPSPEEIRQVLATELPQDPSALVAMVGQSPILLGELMPKVDRRISDATAAQQRAMSDTELRFVRVKLFRNLLQQTIRTKILRESFLLSQVGTQLAEKRTEAEKMMQSRATALFYESQLPELKKMLKVETLSEVEEKLRASGTSVAAQKREFIDMMLGQMYLREVVDSEPDVSLLEISQYYQEHQEDYRHAARARWEQLSVLFEKTPDREQAFQLISEMGNEAFFGGNMQAVAKAKSQEPFAKSGGLHDWTNRGSLASETLEDQIFQLEVGKMSRIIEDAQGYHIVRVLERQEAGATPVGEVQEEIRKTLQAEKVQKAESELLAQMRRKVPVWSVFPDDWEGAMPLENVAAGTAVNQRR